MGQGGAWIEIARRKYSMSLSLSVTEALGLFRRTLMLFRQAYAVTVQHLGTLGNVPKIEL
jgi:hypothetical protein